MIKAEDFRTALGKADQAFNRFVQNVLCEIERETEKNHNSIPISPSHIMCSCSGLEIHGKSAKTSISKKVKKLQEHGN